MAIVVCPAKRFQLGHTSYDGSKVPCSFLSLDTLLRSHFRPFRVAHDPGGWVISLPAGIELWFDTDLGDGY